MSAHPRFTATDFQRLARAVNNASLLAEKLDRVGMTDAARRARSAAQELAQIDTEMAEDPTP